MTTATTVFVCTLNQGLPSWSRYVFPFRISYFALLGNDLYIRHGDYVSVIDPDRVHDDVAGVPTGFTGIVQWPWLDSGQPGVTKMMEGCDIVASGDPSIQIGYDQTDLDAFTAAHSIDPDTYAGDIIPFQVSAAAFSLRITFAGGTGWSLQSANLYVHDNRPGS